MQIGDVVVVKLTGEPVTIIRFDEGNFEGSGTYIVHRAVQTQDGLTYQADRFEHYELLTQEEWFKQDLELKYKFRQIQKSVEARLSTSNEELAVPAGSLPN